MSKWPRLTGKQLMSLLEKEGYALVRIRGSHHHFRRTDGRTVTVPLHANRQLSFGTLRGIATRMMRVSREEFLTMIRKHL